MTQIFVFAQSPHPIPWSPPPPLGHNIDSCISRFHLANGGYSCSCLVCLRLLSGDDALMVQKIRFIKLTSLFDVLSDLLQ